MIKSTKLRRTVAIILSLLMLVGVMPENASLYAVADEVKTTVEETTTEEQKETTSEAVEETTTNVAEPEKKEIPDLVGMGMIKGFEQEYNPDESEAKTYGAIILDENGEDYQEYKFEYADFREGIDYDKLTYDNEIPKITNTVQEKTTIVKVTREGYEDRYFKLTTKITARKIEAVVSLYENGHWAYDEEEHLVVTKIKFDKEDEEDQYTVTYKINNGEATEEIPKLKNPGTYTLTIDIKRKGFKQDAPIRYTIQVDKGIIPMDGNNVKMYEGEYAEGMDTPAIQEVIFPEKGKYEIIEYGVKKEDKDEYTYTEECPNVTQVTDNENEYAIKIKRTDDKNYEVLTLGGLRTNIGKANQSLTFTSPGPEQRSITFGTNNTIICKAKSDAENSGDIFYKIVSEDTTATADINQETGELIYTSTGTIKVRAYTEGNDNYKSAETAEETDLELNIDYVNGPLENNEMNKIFPKAAYEDEKELCKWYEDYVTLSAPEGWTMIAVDNETDLSDLFNSDLWSETITLKTAGIYNDYQVAFQDYEGNISRKYVVPKFAIDNTKPQITRIDFDNLDRAFEYGFFARNEVKVTVTVKDENVSSGIQKIHLYKYAADAGTLLTEIEDENEDEYVEVTTVVEGEETTQYEAVFEVPVEPSFEGYFRAKVEDNVGHISDITGPNTENSNITEKGNNSGYSILENTLPTISNFKVTSFNKVNNYQDIYNGDVTFSFNAQDNESGLFKVIANVKGEEETEIVKEITNSIAKYMKSYNFTTEELKADENGYYDIALHVEDNAGNISNNTIKIRKDTAYPLIAGFKFTPENNMDIEKDGNLYKAVEPTDYGFYFKKDVTVTILAKDYKQDNECASDVDTITYKVVDKTGKVVYSGTKPVKDEKIEFKIDKDFKGQIYAYATDKVGNSPVNSISTKPEQAKKDYPTINKEGYVHPNGSVLETSKKHKETSSIAFSVPKTQGNEDAFDTFKYKGKAQEDANMKKDNSSIFVPLYNADQTFGVTVVDSYSGIRSVKYTIIEGKKQTVSEVIVDNDGKLDTKSEIAGWSVKEKDQNLVTKMSKNIKVSGNYNNMVLLVELTDRAGNISYDYYTFGIDKTAPKVDVSYNNNRANSAKFFKENRTATITVTERNFEEEYAKIKVTKNGKKQNVALEWKTVKGKDNQDDAKHIATIKYDKDGDYTFDMSYKDNAKNVCKKINYGKSVAPKAFTIDKTIPTIAVSFDNNSAKNGKYFDAYRTATVVVKEHNFDAGRVKFKRTASLDGKGASIPSASWSSNGDIHTAKISFNADGDYTFDVTMSDKAGNNSNGTSFGNSIAAKDFTIDTKIDKPSISGVKNGSSYKGKIVPKITLNDVNYDRHEIKLTRTRMGEKNVDVTKEFMKAIGTNGHGGTSISDTFKKKADVDGIYTLSVKMTDKAGNESSEKLMFTINRFGSVYELDTYLADINDGYVNKVDSPLVITEYNADKLVEGSLNVQLTKDGALVKDVKYSANPVANKKVKKGESGWYEYKYTIDASNFGKDGIYKLVISSKDAVGNKPETTNYKDSQITFRVDTTAPEITSIVGLEKAIINAESQDVDFEIFDSIGLKSVKVYVDDNEVKSINKFDEGANCKGTIKLTEGANQNVRLLVEDLAGNVTDTNAESFEPSYEFNDDVTISTNFFVRWYANKLAFWGTIVGLIVVIGGGFFLVIFKRRKDEEEKAQKTK